MTIVLVALAFASQACGSKPPPAAGSPASAASNQVSTSTELGERYADAAGGFSYRPPAGWEVKELPGIKYKLAFGPQIGENFTVNINVVDETYEGSLDDYVSANLSAMGQAFTDFKLVNQEDFSTDQGERGIKISQENVQSEQRLRQHQYFFESGNRKYVVTYTRLVDKGGEFDSLVDLSMKTFQGED